MSVTRRSFSLGMIAGLAGCATSSNGTPQLAAMSGAVPAARALPASGEAPPPTAPDTGYDAWVRAFRGRAAAKGISDATLTAAFKNAGYLPVVIERDQSQFQSRRTLEDYIAVASSDARLSAGRAAMSKHRATLKAVEANYGVQAEVLAAIWGMESSFGARRGATPVISALSTLGYRSRRADFFEGQLVAALRILQRGDISPERMTGSWAGAMGHTQFIPTTFEAYGVDFRGDGRRDIWSDDPTDALASAGN